MGVKKYEGFVVFSTWVISLGLLYTEVALEYSTLLAESFLFFVDVIDVSTLSFFFLMEVIYA